MAGQSWYGSWDRTTDTGQAEQINVDLTAWTGEPGQNREDKSGHDNNTGTAVSGEPWTRLLGQDSWHRTARIGQLGCDSQDRTAREDSQVSTSRTGNRGQDCRNRQQGQDS
jgi:hypothetical protein